MRVAVFDKRQRLIGAREVVKPKKGDVPCGDLPADGTYYHNGATFVPVGFGHGKPRRPDVDRDRAVLLLIKALLDGTPVPQEHGKSDVSDRRWSVRGQPGGRLVEKKKKKKKS